MNFGSASDPAGVHCPYVMYDNGQYRMWYQGTYWAPCFNRISHADKTTLADPWVKDGTVLSNDGLYDSSDAGRPWVLKTDTGYEMFYTGIDASLHYRILHATSTDGMSWTKDGVVIEPSLPLENSVGYQSVIKDGDTYKMWYSGYSGSNWRIFYAEKTPGHIAQNATCTVSFYLDTVNPTNLIGTSENVFVPANGQTPVSINWTPVAGTHEIIAVVSGVNPPDNNLSNNIASKPITVIESKPAILKVDKVRLSGPVVGFTHTYYEWELQIIINNTGGSIANDVLVKDVLPAELELLLTNASIGNVTTQAPGTRSSPPSNEISPVRSTHIFWVVGTLASGQSETLYLKVCTRVNPGGNQEFTSPGIYVINEGAYATGVDSLTGQQIISNPAQAITVTIDEQAPVVGLPPAPKPVNWNTVNYQHLKGLALSARLEVYMNRPCI